MKRGRFSVNMKKIFCFLFLLIIANLAANAQQDPQFSFNKLTHLTINPGYAGAEEGVTGLILNRYQWSGYGNSPQTLVFSVGARTKLFGADNGIGLNVVSDEQGFERNAKFNFNYAHRFSTSFGDWGIGTSLGFFNKSYKGKWEAPDNEGTVDWDTNDPLLPQGEVSQMAFDAGIGVYLKAKKYFVGASVTHINQAEIKYNEQVIDYLARHYYLLAGCNISLPDPLFVLQPSILIKSDLVGYQVDLNAEVIYNDRISGGLNYRIDDGISVLLRYELANGLRAGYAFDLTTSEIGRYGYGSHELFISYNFDLGKGRLKKYKSVRFL